MNSGICCVFFTVVYAALPYNKSDDWLDEDTIVQDDNPAESTAREIKAAARDMLRMGSRWAHNALDWIDERRHEMNHHNRDERDYGGERQRSEYSPSSASGQGDWQDRERHAQRQYGGRREQLQGHSDREIQGDYSGGGYDQVGSRAGWSRGSEYGQRSEYEREGSYAQSRTRSPDDDSLRGDYGSSYGSGGGSGYSGAGYGYGASGAGGVGYGAPGYGAGSSYAEPRYHGDFQSRGIGEEEGYGSYGREFASRGDTSGFGRDVGRMQGGRGQEGYGQSWREQRTYGSAAQGYGARGGEQQSYGSEFGYGRSGQPYGQRGYQGYGSSDQGSQRLQQGYGRQGSRGTQSSEPGRSYRGVGPRNYTRSDERIREDLNERLTDAHDIDASMITVEVSNGVATLTGTVSERWMKHRAEDIADGCTGVSDVRNNLQVQSQSGQSGLGRQSQGSQYGSSQGSSQMGTSGQYGGSTSGTQGSNLGTSASASSQGSSLGTGTSAASQGSSAGSQGTTRGSSSSGTSSTGPNV